MGVLQIGIRAWLQHSPFLGSCESRIKRYCYLHLLLEEKGLQIEPAILGILVEFQQKNVFNPCQVITTLT
jgi:hypothetical protein